MQINRVQLNLHRR